MNPGYYPGLYRAFMKAAILGNIQYRASGMIWMIGSILEPLIYLVVWSTVASERGGSVGGYSAREFAAYYIVLLLVNHLTFTWIMQVFQFRIQFGQLSYELLRPVHPIHADVTDNIAYKIVQMTVMLPALVILVILFDPQFGFTPLTIAMAIPVLLLAFTVRFLMEWTLALAAFWTTRTIAINNTYFSVTLFLSGRIAPIALLPAWLQDTAQILPFYYVIAFPVEIINGNITGQAIVDGILMLCGWLVITFFLMRLVWRRAIRTFSAVGG
ncbi:MAG: ABC transporter permease [Pseudomonadota bacterium]